VKQTVERTFKKGRAWVFLLLGMMLLLQPATRASAETAYITDIFKITLRSGPSTENKIIRMLSSGQAVEVLEAGDDWTHVRVAGLKDEENEGWVLSRYLITRLPWDKQAASLEKENTELREKMGNTEKSYKETLHKEKEVSGELREVSEALKKVRNDYETLKAQSANYLKLKESYETNVTSLENAKKRLQAVTDENAQLRDSEQRRWFITGAAVLLGGFIVGLVLGKRQKRRSSLYS
jgi:SH3 domain protein